MILAQPYYYLDLAIFGCNYDIRINDIPLLRELYDRPLSAEIPINHLLIPGKNEVCFKLKPLEGHEKLTDLCSLTFEIFEKSSSKTEKKEKILTYSAPNFSDGTKVIFYDCHTFSASITTTPLWQNGLVLDLKNGLFEELVTEYQKIASIFRMRSVEPFLQLTINRIKDMAACYNDSFQTEWNDVKKSLQKDFDDNDFELVDIQPNYLRPGVYGKGHLCCLEYETFKSPIVLKNKATGSYKYYPLYFMRDKESKALTVIR